MYLPPSSLTGPADQRTDTNLEFFCTLGGKKLTTFPVGPNAAAEMYWRLQQAAGATLLSPLGITFQEFSEFCRSTPVFLMYAHGFQTTMREKLFKTALKLASKYSVNIGGEPSSLGMLQQAWSRSRKELIADGNELHYLLNFKRQENAYYICHAFVECHTKAQRKLAMTEEEHRGYFELFQSVVG